jgi:hypothetical protein
MLLSGFNGGQAYLISAVIKNATTLESGLLYAGFSGKETWKAQKNEAAALPDVGNVPDILDSIQALNFTFPDLDSNLISLMDKRFSGKTLIIQTMGSWCPNCMDESRYINELYLKYKHMGVEVIGLAYEYSDDFGRSKKTLLKLRQRLNIQYPLLITGMKLTDSLRTAKTLPQISPIKVFPTTLLLDRQKRIKKIYSGFYGPGSGIHYEMFKKEFETELMRILKSGD